MENEIDFFKKKSLWNTQLERQMVQMEILLVLIWVQAVISKGYQQTTKVASSKESVNKSSLSCLYFIHIASLCFYSLSSNCLQR